MLTNLNSAKPLVASLAALLFCGTAAMIQGATSVSAQPDGLEAQPVHFELASAARADDNAEVRVALTSFIQGMASADAAKVWTFASEEDQEAFETEDGVYSAFAETFPVLADAREVTLIGFSEMGDTPFATVALKDSKGDDYTASLGFWLDDAGDWKLVSCDVQGAGDRLT